MGIAGKIKNFIHTIIWYTKEEKIVPVITPVDKDKLLAGKVALITGGSGGIGIEIARTFISSGAKVILVGTNENKLNIVCKSLGGRGDSLKSIVIDVTHIGSLTDKIKDAAGLFEENRIDILVNSAGVNSRNSFLNTTELEYDSIMNTNAKGTYFVCQAVAKFMIDNKTKGHILNVSSSSALRPAWTPYQMSKWAIRGFTMGLADTLLPYGIIVNAIAPGQTATPMFGKDKTDNIYNPNTKVGRFAMPQEIASLALYMVSDAGNMIVGDTFYVTGGSGTITYHG